MKLHPFTPERQVGVIFQVEGSFADVTLSAAARLPRSHFGEYLGRGEVGEFVVIDVGGTGVFGRLLRVAATTTNLETLTQPDRRVPAEARIQLLSTLHLNGSATRGVLKYPKIGDPVYAASAEAILTVLGTATSEERAVLPLGRLSVDESVVVSVPLSRLFGRHLAVVGATGSGKSWTLGHLAESVGRLNGKMIIIDATGEFHTLAGRATHLSFGSIDNEPAGATLVGIPHYMMRESDRNAFLNPSSGTQLPKLREAVRSLRLSRAIRDDPEAESAHRRIPREDGQMVKTGGPIAVYQAATAKYIAAVEGLHAPFDIRLLATQVQNECIWANGQGQNADRFGGPNGNDLGYVSSLVSRINDLLQIPEIMGVIDGGSASANVIDELARWCDDSDAHLIRISLSPDPPLDRELINEA